MTSTLAPRMQVDNGISFFSYRGVCLNKWRTSHFGKESLLLEAVWRPCGDGVWEVRLD